MADTPAMDGAEAFAAWFGGWPSFHDAEIHALHLNRKGTSLLKIQTWRMTNGVDDKGFFVCEKSTFVTFSIRQITALTLEDFSHQNVIAGLVIEKISEGWVMTLESCYGLFGIIEAKEISVAFDPVETYPGPSA